MLIIVNCLWEPSSLLCLRDLLRYGSVSIFHFYCRDLFGSFWGCFHILWSWIPVFECVPCSLVSYLNTVTNQKQHCFANLVIIQWFFHKSVMWELILKPSCKLGPLVLAPWNHLNIKWMDLIQHPEFTNVDWLLQKKISYPWSGLVKNCTMKMILGDPCDRNDIWQCLLEI